MPDIAIPIVFPDYLIAVETPRAIEVPDLLPNVDLLPERLALPSYSAKLPELGHAGILFLEGKSGTTQYFEFGRYDRARLGAVKKRTIRDVKMQNNGHPTHDSLAYVLSQISVLAGQGGRIRAAYIAAPGAYGAMRAYCRRREAESNQPKRLPYNIFRNSCVHFMNQTLAVGGVKLPSMLDPRPNSYIDELRAMYPKLDYSKSDHSLKVEAGMGELAYRTKAFTQPAAA